MFTAKDPLQDNQDTHSLRRARWTLRWRVYAAGVALPTGLALFADGLWLGELATHFRVQYAGLSLLALVGLALCRSWKWAAGTALVLGLQLIQIVPLYVGPDLEEHRGPKRRLLLCNVLTQNHNPLPLLELIEEQRPDFIVLEEVSLRWARELRELEGAYPHRRWAVRDDNFGIGFLSRWPLDSCEILQFGSAGVPSVVAKLEIDGRPLTILGTHPLNPTSRRFTALRNEQLAALREYALETPGEILLAGDLNTTSWSPAFRLLCDGERLRDTRLGFGVQWTWPSSLMPMGIPLDHCLVSSGIQVDARWVGPSVESDHLPVLMDFSLPDLPEHQASSR